MTEFEKKKYENFVQEFNKVAKRIANYKNKTLPTDQSKIEKYKADLVNALNDIRAYANETNNSLIRDDKVKLKDLVHELDCKFLAHLAILRFTAEIPCDYADIELNKVTEIDTNTAHNISAIVSDIEEETDDNQVLTSKDKNNVPSSSTQITFGNLDTDETIMTDFEFALKINQLIKKTYSGDPNELESFLEAIELAELGATVENTPALIKCIKQKLVGKAREALPAQINSVNEIKIALKAKIKQDNVNVVLGRLLALRSDKTSMQNFQEKAEELAEKLRLAYISKGIPSDVAKQMTIEETVNMCRFSAKTQLVKSVLASKEFAEPKEVLSRFVTEITQENKEIKEAQVLSFGGGYRGNNRRRGRGNFNHNYNNNYGNRNGSYDNRNYQNNNYRGNNRGRNRFDRGGRGRGRGNDRFVRVVAAENATAPTIDRGNNQETLTVGQANHN